MTSSTPIQENSKAKCSNQLNLKHLNHLDGWMRKVMEFLYHPIDPSSLGITRILYGFLMIVDTTQERGMEKIPYKYKDPEACFFPLFNILTPLSADWMHVVYLSMIIAAFCICIGFCYRFVTIWLAVCYWYVFLLDKTTWNNHSYLFGLFALFFSFTKANRWCSVDGKLDQSIRNTHIPRWHLALFQFQIFLVYFYAGIKKLDPDWITGNSMVSLEAHWVFSLFHYVLTPEQVNLYIVHYGGFAFDLMEGFLLFFDITRPIGLLLGFYFHFSNACMFTIGIFPYAMLATLPIFCRPDWPKRLLVKTPQRWQRHFIIDAPKNYSSSDCIAVNSAKLGIRRFTKKNKFTLFALSCYIAIQLFLPFSHNVTKGYTGWDDHGLYGYSWDMMVHTWATQHVKITVVDLSNGRQFHLKPSVCYKYADRWNSHPDMIKQYATCIGRRVKKLGVKQPAVYFDIWKSMNRRFKQRTVDPSVDVLAAPWSPFTKTPWMMPLLKDFTWWRSKMVELDEKLLNDSITLSTNYVADFPGFTLENFVPEVYRVNLTVLQGTVRISVGQKGHNIDANQTAILPNNRTHEVRVVSKEPASYYYLFSNITMEKMIDQELNKINSTEETAKNGTTTYLKSIKKKLTPIYRFIYLKGLLYYHIGNNTINALSNILRNCNCDQNLLPTNKP
ncbi:uncharacterized protein TRIADDRAFT_30063 [Trichoplax adhaerens]|uniref:Vitamin K-dependent gamma-carboxylase n=1 Tax=Trichoplax adhaerens TaxID=10228 RepID=B3S6S8_TRIAD|nr:hypothetical protein TRIADDRAFT_30063 [Trichoplax adhaerens]EDV21674.1 hypothetical protein TRIADDRAFT_30063 [Trichoplax adhaerens]|eukprot:XP_002115822.1 hypothetical protein TRIADDRAFT_30063 [Trichoplax adhaerens]